ncbi:MAG: hypothetical protein HWN65_11140 [Candidatus Helarchaeota archaeon]|nr:hypothetical protein [Candidatus Helarchaeota archaeon]
MDLSPLSGVKDELEELTFLIDPRIFIAEYIPFGSNHIIAFNDELDSLGAVQGGLLTSLIDKEPRKCTFMVTDDLTTVKVRRFDPNDFIQFEAAITFENIGGVEQLEDFGVHIDASGRVIYGCELIELVGKRDKHSLDNISRVIADLVTDSSEIMQNLLTTYQRRLLDLVYFNEPMNRNKFIILTGRYIDPVEPAKYFVHEADYKNELNQIIKQAYYGRDFSNGDKCFFGSEGLIIIARNLEPYEELLAIIGFFQGLDIFQKNYFSKMFMLWDEVRDARILVDKSSIDPNAIGEAQVILSSVSSAVVLMTELLRFMQTAVNLVAREFDQLKGPDEKLPPVQEELSYFIQLDDTVKKASIRIEDAELIVRGLKDEITGVNGLITTLSERQMRQMNEALKDSITSMDEMTRSSERTGVALNILEVVLTGAIAFDILLLFVGQYEWTSLSGWITESALNIALWAALSIALFFMTGWSILRLIRHLEERSEPNLRVSLKLGAVFDTEKFEAYISSKPIKQQQMIIRSGSRMHEYTWDDDDKKWRGNEVTITAYLDIENKIFLAVNVNVDSPKKITTKQASEAMFNELIDAGIIPKEIIKLLG